VQARWDEEIRMKRREGWKGGGDFAEVVVTMRGWRDTVINAPGYL
jgi:hypothetical protein